LLQAKERGRSPRAKANPPSGNAHSLAWHASSLCRTRFLDAAPALDVRSILVGWSGSLRQRLGPWILAAAALGVLVWGARRATADVVPLPELPAEKVVLPNGLTVLLAPDSRTHLASVLVSYAAGTADEPDGLRGLAHMVEHLTAPRTKHSRSLMKELERAGACHFNARTSFDGTYYFESLPPERLATALWAESERMGYAADAVTDERLEAERHAIENEDRDRHTDSLLGSYEELAASALYPPWHPYARASESRDDLGGIRAADVRAFMRTWYVPSNATLAVAGAFDRDATLATIERYFGTLPAGGSPKRPALKESTVAPVKLLVAAPEFFPMVSLAWRTPVIGSPDDRALDLIATAVAREENNPLNRALVATGLASSVFAREVSARLSSVFIVTATLELGVDPNRVIQAIQGVLDAVARGADPQEVARARSIRERSAQAALETTWGRASQLVLLDAVEAGPGPRFDWGQTFYQSVDTAAVTRAAARWLGRSHRVATIVSVRRAAPIRGVLTGREDDAP
jgi:zinc protease